MFEKRCICPFAVKTCREKFEKLAGMIYNVYKLNYLYHFSVYNYIQLILNIR